MRKFNAILVSIILILIIDHIIFASMHLLGTGANVFVPVALFMLTLVLIHAIISLIITINAEKVGINTKARYNKENEQFWLRRVSGLAIMVLAIMHAYLEAKNENGVPNVARMPKIFEFTLPLLILSVGIHVFQNTRPLLISLGIKKINLFEKIIKILVIMLTCLAMFSIVTFLFNKMKRG